MALEIEATKSMTTKSIIEATKPKKDLKRNEQTMKKVKRILEVSSAICSTASINMVIACLYGGVPDILGFKSQEMIFDLAFSLIVASVVLGTLAMATSSIQNRNLKISFPSLIISECFSGLLTSILAFKNKDIAGREKFSKPENSQPSLNNAECIKKLKEKRGNQDHSNSLDNSSIKSSEDDEYSLENAGKSTVFSPSSVRSSEIKGLPQLQNHHYPFLFGHCSITRSPTHLTKSLKFMQFDLEQMEKKSQLVPLLQQTFITNGHFNEVNARSESDRHPQVGIVSPIKINNSNDVENCDLYKNFSASKESIRTCQKYPNIRCNTNSLVEQQSFYQKTGIMSNARFQVDDNIRYESNAPIKTFHKYPGSKREVFNNRLYTTDLQNLHELRNELPRVKCNDSREIPYKELLQTIRESSDEFSNKGSCIGKSKKQEVDSGDHYYKLHRKVTPNFKSFHHPLRDFKEAPHEQSGVNNHHYGWNISSNEWGESFVERPDIPMEICDKVPNDQVLEVSMKLNDLNFMF